jgi:ribose 5-phosphate isomerase A
MQPTVDDYKQQAALQAVRDVRSGMVIGLGHGSTAIYALKRIGELIGNGQLSNVQGVPCSRKVEAEARQLGIPLTSLDQHPVLDLTIDGADEADEKLRLIKGGGGALMREKIVAQASRREIIVLDQTKLSDSLGRKSPVPVEVLPFGWRSQAEFLALLGGDWKLRLDQTGQPFLTDQNNYVLDCIFDPILDPAGLARQMSMRAGILEHGLFLDLASELILAGPDGLRRIRKTESQEEVSP